MDSKGTADISPSARFGVTEANVTKTLYKGLVELYKIELGLNKVNEHDNGIVFLEDCRQKYLDQNGNVCWSKVAEKWDELRKVKTSLANKFFTSDVRSKAESLSQADQQTLLDTMMGGLENSNSSVGVYASKP
jgi:creatine kinase